MVNSQNLAPKLNLLFESNPLAAIEWDTDFRIVAWNQAATEVFGHSKEEAIDRNLLELIVPKELHKSLGGFLHLLCQGTESNIKSCNSINKNITKTGEIIVCDWQDHPLFDDQGQVTGFLSIVQNTSISPLRDIDGFFLNSLDLLCIISMEGYFQKLNTAWLDTLGYTDEELKARPFIEFVHPEDVPATLAEAEKLAQGQDVLNFENRYRSKDGSYIWFSWRITLSADRQLMYAIARDITTQKEAEVVLREQEEEIRQSEKRYQALMEAKLLETQGFLESVLTNLPLAVFAKEAQDLKMILWNPAAEELFKIKAKDIIGTSNYDLFPPEQADFFTEKDREALNSPEVIDIPEEIAQDGQGINRIFHTKKTAVLDGEGVPQSLLVITEDITERKAAEQQLKEQAAILQAFVDHTPVPIAMYDKEMRYLIVNQSWLVDNNFVGQDIIGRSHYDVFPNIPDRWKEVHQRCLAGATESHEADPFHRVDGSIDYIRWQILPWRNAQGEIGGILAYSEMITERVKAEEERRNLAAIVSNASDFIGIASLEGKLLYTNPAGLVLTGLESLELARTKEIIDLFVPRERESVFQSTDTDIIPEGKWQGERTFQHFVTGEEIPAHANTFLVNDPITNQPLYTAAIIRDIRAEKAAEQQLQKKADREELLNRINNKIRSSLDFNEILEKAVTEIHSFLNVDYCGVNKYLPPQEDQVAYWEVLAESKIPGIPDTPQKYPTSAVGAISERLLNLQTVQIDDTETCNDLEVKNILQLFGVSSIVMIPSLLSNSLLVSFSCVNYQQPRQWLEDEVELLEAVMEQLAIALNQAELYQKAESRAQELEEILRELQRTQGQLVQSEKMSSLGQLVAGVAHEINNPVNFIYGNLSHVSEYSQDLIRLLELYQKYYPTPVAEIEAEAEAVDLEFLLTDLPPLLNSMKVGADRIKQIVLSLRNFSRMDESAMKSVDIHEGIDSTLMILQNRLKAKSHQPEIVVIKEYGEIPPLECYAGELNQVFMNIITNAIDALDERDSQLTFAECQQNPSQISIHTTLVHNQNHPVSPEVQITISDNGSGIPPAVQQRIFDPFFTTKEIGKGTGLGMSISYQVITERHYGSLICKSQLGEGASFIIRIPLQQN
jgi:PAS domain S-box-containing protein